MCASAIAAALRFNTTLELLRFDEAELPVQVLAGRVPEGIVELRSPGAQPGEEGADNTTAPRSGRSRRRSSAGSSARLSAGHRRATRSQPASSMHSGGSTARSSQRGDYMSYDGQSGNWAAATTAIPEDGPAPNVVLADAGGVVTPLQPITLRESVFVGDIMRLCDNTTITSLDGVTLVDLEHARFYNGASPSKQTWQNPVLVSTSPLRVCWQMTSCITNLS